MKWKHFPRYWPLVRGIHRSPVNSPHKGQWRGALVFFLIFTWTNISVNNPDVGGLWRHRAYYDVIVMTNYRYVISSVGAHGLTKSAATVFTNLVSRATALAGVNGSSIVSEEWFIWLHKQGFQSKPNGVDLLFVIYHWNLGHFTNMV